MSAVLLATLVGLIVIRVPIAFAIGIASAVTMFFMDIDPIITVSRMFQGVNVFPLLAVPFFLLAGQLMNSGAITDDLIRLAMALVGHVRGGLAHVNVFVSMLFAGMSGSAVADTAGVGSVMIPAMERKGYPTPFAVAITAASSTMGTIIPPSILMVIYGSVSNVSIGALFIAGILPGILFALSQMGYALFEAYRKNHPAEPWGGFCEIAAASRRSVAPLMIPVIILGGVMLGQFTATEAGMIAVIYAGALVLVFRRSLTLRQVPNILSDVVVNYSLPVLAVSTATVFGWLLAFLEVPGQLIEFLGPVATSPTAALLVIFAVFLIVGSFLDAIPAIIIFHPIVEKLVESSGADPLQAGIVVITTLAIGFITPPYGLCLLVATMIGKTSVVAVMPNVFVFVVLSALVVIALALFPAITLLLPSMLMDYGV